MKINNRIIQYTMGVFFLLAWACLCLKLAQNNSNHKPSEFKVSAATTNEGITLVCQIRKLSLEITLFSNTY